MKKAIKEIKEIEKIKSKIAKSLKSTISLNPPIEIQTQEGFLSLVDFFKKKGY